MRARLWEEANVVPTPMRRNESGGALRNFREAKELIRLCRRLCAKVALANHFGHNHLKPIVRRWRMPMNADLPLAPWTDPRFVENQGRFPMEKLLSFQGQHIAWSWDGSQILAADKDRQALDQKLRAAGFNPVHVLHDFVEDPSVSYLG
jgi:hypothetical protein